MSGSQQRASWSAGLLTATALSLAACQTFRPVEPTDVRPGQTVRVELADSAERDAAGWTGPDRQRLTGELVRWSREGMALSMRSRIGAAGLSPYRDTLQVPKSLIRSVHRQEISALRSAAVAGGVVGAAALLVHIDLAGGGGRSPQPGGGGPVESVGFRIVIPLVP